MLYFWSCFLRHFKVFKIFWGVHGQGAIWSKSQKVKPHLFEFWVDRQHSSDVIFPRIWPGFANILRLLFLRKIQKISRTKILRCLKVLWGLLFWEFQPKKFPCLAGWPEPTTIWGGGRQFGQAVAASHSFAYRKFWKMRIFWHSFYFFCIFWAPIFL